MDTLTLIQPYLPIIFTVITLGVAFGIWKLYNIYTARKIKKTSILRVKKCAGVATEEELDFLFRNLKYDRAFAASKKKNAVFNWKEFNLKEFISNIDIKATLNRYNPFNVIRQLEKLQKDYDTLKKDHSRVSGRGWDMDRKINKLVEKVEPLLPKEEPKEEPILHKEEEMANIVKATINKDNRFGVGPASSFE